MNKEINYIDMLKNDIKSLNLNDDIYSKLKCNKIDTLDKLCSHTRKELRDLDFPQGDIQSLIIKLQLNGLDIKGNVY